jgi:hypothetical protein
MITLPMESDPLQNHGIHQQAAEILESINDAFCALDQNGRLTYLNSAAERMLGRPRQELLGKDVRQEFPLVLGSRLEQECLRALEQNVPVQLESYYTPLRRWMEVRVYPSPSGLSVYLQDITDRKRIEEERAYLLRSEQAARAEAEAANRRKDQFLAVLSHELRTPLTPVLARLALLKRDPALSSPVQSSVEMIRRNVELEASLIDDLLDITRIARGNLPLNLEAVDAHEKIRDALEIYKSAIAAKRQLVTLDLAARQHEVRADPARLQQIFWNLVSNAVKYTPEGGHIAIGSSNENAALTVQISDDGVGIEPEVMPRLFRTFEQGEQSLTRRFGGLGLGLAICKSLIEMHGGKIQAHSDGRDRGATFTVTLPTLDAVPRHPAPRLPARILLVEDNDDTRQVMTKLLHNAGHQVRAAASVQEARQAAAAETFDVLISDLGLPDGSGWELMRQLNAERRIRGIALSGFGTDQDMQKSKDAGFTAHLTKPIDFRRLEEAIALARA